MNFKKIAVSLSMLATTTSLMANENISYDYFDLSYGYSGSSFTREDTYTLDSSFSINDRFYLKAGIERLLRENEYGTNHHKKLGRTNYNFSLGFHTKISKRTDFYAELGYEHSKISVPFFDVNSSSYYNFKHSKDSFVASIGTRTAFSEKFEFLTKLQYVNRDYPNYPIYQDSNDRILFETFRNDDVNLSLMGLYKFNSKNALKFGVDTSSGYTLGWRYNW